MELAGLGVRDALGVVREARAGAARRGAVAVRGVLAAELAKLLAARAADAGAVRVGGEPAGALALVVVLAGPPSAEDEAAMRAAARALVPVVAVQTDARVDVRLPYVLPAAVVTCPPGRGFPLDEIAAALAEQLDHGAVPLAAALPALRAPLARGLVRAAAARAAAVGALPWRKGADFPVLTALQARLVLDLAAAHGREVGQARAPELAAVAATGYGLRSLVRRLAVRPPLVGALTGYLATRALGEAALRRFAADGSVRPGS